MSLCCKPYRDGFSVQQAVAAHRFDGAPYRVAEVEYLAKTEGIIPAIESAHAVAHARKIAPAMSKDQIIVITISGRGDKDCAAIARYRGEDIHE